MGHIDELTLAQRAAGGDSRSAAELRQRVLRCAVSVARKARWLDAVDAAELEEDVPNEAMLRLIVRVRHGFDGECGQFRSYLYRVVTSVTADAVRRNLDRRKQASLDAPFESADGGESTLRDVVENGARIGRMGTHDLGPEEASLVHARDAEVAGAVARLDPWCQILVREAIVGERPHADIAREQHVSVQMLDVSLKRCTERLYRSLLSAYVNGPERLKRQAVAEAAGNLPEELRVVFVPWWTENASVKQIAARCGLDTDEARRRLARAKASMWALAGTT